MTKDELKLKRSIMRRVYTVWMLRTLGKPVFVRPAILLALLWQFSTRVSFGHVFANSPELTNLAENLAFYTSAFSGAGIYVQLLILLLAATALWFLKDTLTVARLRK